MNIVRRMLVATMAAAAFVSVGAVAADVNVTGTWNMAVETPAGTGSPTFTLKQEGTAVTGQYQGQLGEAPVTGTVKGNELTLNYKVNAQGTDLSVTYIGTVDGDTIKGKVSLGELGEGTFTGKRG
jgi:hypothetical protein